MTVFVESRDMQKPRKNQGETHFALQKPALAAAGFEPARGCPQGILSPVIGAISAEKSHKLRFLVATWIATVSGFRKALSGCATTANYRNTLRRKRDFSYVKSDAFLASFISASTEAD